MRVAAVARDEAHMRDVVAFRGRLLDLAEELGVDRVALVLEDIERERDVGGGHARAVGKARLGPQAKAIVALVGGNAHRLCEQPVDRIRLVAVRRHQRVEGRRHAGRAIAFPAVDVERVEGVKRLVAARAGDLQREQTAGRRRGVHIGEMRKVRGQGEVAEGGEAVRLDRIVGERRERSRKEADERSACASLQHRSPRQGLHHRRIRLEDRASRAMYRASGHFASDRGENEARPARHAPGLPAGNAGQGPGAAVVGARALPHNARGSRVATSSTCGRLMAPTTAERAFDMDEISSRPLDRSDAAEAAALIRAAFAARPRATEPPSSALVESA